jgi:hypothetical protein
MLFASAFVFAFTALPISQQLEDEELALDERSMIIEDDEATEDGELIFDSDEIVAEFDDEFYQ